MNVLSVAQPSPCPTSLSSSNVIVLTRQCVQTWSGAKVDSRKSHSPVQVRSTLGPLKFFVLSAPSLLIRTALNKDCTHVVTEKGVRHAQCFICTCSRFVDVWKDLFFRFRLPKGSDALCVLTNSARFRRCATSCEKRDVKLIHDFHCKLWCSRYIHTPSPPWRRTFFFF